MRHWRIDGTSSGFFSDALIPPEALLVSTVRGVERGAVLTAHSDEPPGRARYFVFDDGHRVRAGVVLVRLLRDESVASANDRIGRVMATHAAPFTYDQRGIEALSDALAADARDLEQASGWPESFGSHLELPPNDGFAVLLMSDPARVHRELTAMAASPTTPDTARELLCLPGSEAADWIAEIDAIQQRMIETSGVPLDLLMGERRVRPAEAEPALTLPDMERSWERESFAEVASRLWGGG